jgi:hypothetical protein
MPCKIYREALIEAAASDSAASFELRSHLDACASCRASFAEELQLFAAIDAGVRAAANAEVPHSLFPRVHASLEDVSASQRRWTPFLIFAAASAAIVLTVFIATRPGHTINENQARKIFAAPSGEKPTTPDRLAVAGTRAVMTPLRANHMRRRENSTALSSATSTRLEVLVPPDEREALALFISSQLERTDLVIAVVATVSDNKDRPLSVEPLEIAELEVKRLESLADEVPDGTEEKQ